MTRFAILLAFILTSTLALGADLPQWRGPDRDGVAPGAKVPAKWAATHCAVPGGAGSAARRANVCAVAAAGLPAS